MRTETFCYSITCDECGLQIDAHERHAVIQKPVKNIFNVPIEMSATKISHIHLKQVYNQAQQKLNNKFFQLDIFEVQQ